MRKLVLPTCVSPTKITKHWRKHAFINRNNITFIEIITNFLIIRQYHKNMRFGIKVK